MRSRRRRHSASTIRPLPGGQSLPEFMIAVPVFLFLILLIFQMILIYRAKTILDYATLEAARLGAVNGAQVKDMERGLIRGLTPLHASDKDAVVGLDPTCLISSDTAWCKAKKEVESYASITIISPTQEAMATFREKQYDDRYAIPNDNLAYRKNIPNPYAGVNVQDANILKIKVDYNYPLIVPFVDRVIRGASVFFRGGGNTELVAPAQDNFFRIPLQSHVTLRMQSPVYEDEVCPDTGNCYLPSLADLQ